MGDLKALLGTLEYPFTWNPQLLDYNKDRVIKNETAYSGQQFKRIIGYLVLYYEYGVMGDWNKSEECLKHCDNILELDNSFINLCRNELKNVVATCRAHICMERDEIDATSELLDSVVPIKKMNKNNQASMWLLKGCFLMKFGPNGTLESLKCMKNAVELCEEEALYHFYLSRVLAKIRHLQSPSPPPTDEEILHMETAYALSPIGTVCCHLAALYCELASDLFRQKPLTQDKKNTIESFNDKAFYILKKIEDDDITEDTVLFGRTLLSFPAKYGLKEKGLSVLESLVDKNLDITSVNHVLGNYYLSSKKYEKSIPYLEKSLDYGCHNAGLSLLTAKIRVDPGFDPSDLFSKLLSEFTLPWAQHRTHRTAAVYYIMCKKDLASALKHFQQAVDIDDSHKSFQNTIHFFNDGFGTVDVCEMMNNELRVALEEEDFNKLSREKLEEILTHIRKIAPDLLEREIRYEKGRMNSRADTNCGWSAIVGSSNSNWRTMDGFGNTNKSKRNYFGNSYCGSIDSVDPVRWSRDGCRDSNRRSGLGFRGTNRGRIRGTERMNRNRFGNTNWRNKDVSKRIGDGLGGGHYRVKEGPQVRATDESYGDFTETHSLRDEVSLSDALVHLHT